MKTSELKLRYNSEAPIIDDFLSYSTYGSAWERYSLPLGNGFFGANVFARLGEERVQISDPTLANPYYAPKKIKRRASCSAGVNSMAELLINFSHNEATEYSSVLSLDDATHTVSYLYGGVRYKRTSFASHPDRVFVMRIEADSPAAVDFSVRLIAPFLGEYCIEIGDGMGKSGETVISADEIAVRGKMEYYGILYECRLKVITDGGKITSRDDGIGVSGANTALLILTCATNYELCERVFNEFDPKRKLAGNPSPELKVRSVIDVAAAKGYEALLSSHLRDYKALFGRVKLNIGEEIPDVTTDELLRRYKAGERSAYLELLLYQYGRYLMIASSRTLLPAHLQGIWNAFSDSPWSAGYWHNINVQMNYWSVGSANLSELFLPYVNYACAYMNTARANADALVREFYPEKLSPNGENGWIIGTGAWPYCISEFKAGGHSGPGTGAFTALLFWDHFDYTADREFLRKIGYPALREMSVLYSKILTEVDGSYLIRDSASPENVHNGKYYHTVGCAFDQQMVYECFKRTIVAAYIIGERDEFIDKLENILPKLDPVLIGDDGQIKEYREETGYSSIGEPNHRHISHLVGLYPGTVINDSHPEWIDAAKVTLNKRGDKSTGWACAHRLLLWARTGDAERTMDLLTSLIKNNIMENLWDNHPPFQIDGNFGYTAAVGEMLVGGHDGTIHILKALPKEWDSGEFSGIVSRGGIEFDCKWERGAITYLAATAKESASIRIILGKGGETVNVDLSRGERRVIVG